MQINNKKMLLGGGSVLLVLILLIMLGRGSSPSVGQNTAVSDEVAVDETTPHNSNESGDNNVIADKDVSTAKPALKEKSDTAMDQADPTKKKVTTNKEADSNTNTKDEADTAKQTNGSASKKNADSGNKTEDDAAKSGMNQTDESGSVGSAGSDSEDGNPLELPEIPLEDNDESGDDVKAPQNNNKSDHNTEGNKDAHSSEGDSVPSQNDDEVVSGNAGDDSTENPEEEKEVELPFVPFN